MFGVKSERKPITFVQNPSSGYYVIKSAGKILSPEDVVIALENYQAMGQTGINQWMEEMTQEFREVEMGELKKAYGGLIREILHSIFGEENQDVVEEFFQNMEEK